MKNKKKFIIIGVIVLLLIWFGFKTVLTVMARDYAGETEHISYEKIDVKYSEPTDEVIRVGNLEMANMWNLTEQEMDFTRTFVFKGDDEINLVINMTPADEVDYMEAIEEDVIFSKDFFKKHELENYADIFSYMSSYDDSVSTLSTFYPLPKLLDQYRSVKLRALLVPMTTETIYEAKMGTTTMFILMREKEFGGAHISIYDESGDMFGVSINDDNHVLTKDDIFDFVSTIKYNP